MMDSMEVVADIARIPFETPTDQVLKITRYAAGLLLQYGFENQVCLDLKTNSFVDPEDEDFDGDSALAYTQFATDLYETTKGNPFAFDNIPLLEEGELLIEPGFVVLHVYTSEYEDLGPEDEVAQITFRQETHKDGPAVLKGTELIPIESSEELRYVKSALQVLEMIMRNADLNDPESPFRIYPVSELSDDFEKFCREAAEE